MKTCLRCHDNLPLSAFWPAMWKPQGVDDECKPCTKLTDTERYEAQCQLAADFNSKGPSCPCHRDKPLEDTGPPPGVTITPIDSPATNWLVNLGPPEQHGLAVQEECDT